MAQDVVLALQLLRTNRQKEHRHMKLTDEQLTLLKTALDSAAKRYDDFATTDTPLTAQFTKQARETRALLHLISSQDEIHLVNNTPDPAPPVKIGECGVDAGMLYLGDPCYVINAALGRKPWDEFIRAIAGPNGYLETYATVESVLPNGKTPFNAGVVVTTGYGDGVYPVYAEFSKTGHIARITVEFISDDD